jgi:hypothetical protein
MIEIDLEHASDRSNGSERDRSQVAPLNPRNRRVREAGQPGHIDLPKSLSDAHGSKNGTEAQSVHEVKSRAPGTPASNRRLTCDSSERAFDMIAPAWRCVDNNRRHVDSLGSGVHDES